MKLVKNGADPATLVDYLRELKRNATSLERKELEVEKARLKGEILRVEKDLEVEKARSDAAQARSQVKVVTLQAELKQTTAKYLLVRGLLHMRGLMGGWESGFEGFYPAVVLCICMRNSRPRPDSGPSAAGPCAAGPRAAGTLHTASAV